MARPAYTDIEYETVREKLTSGAMECSGRINPYTFLSGSITLIEEVFNGKEKAPVI
jgi:hypothetical protein